MGPTFPKSIMNYQKSHVYEGQKLTI